MNFIEAVKAAFRIGFASRGEAGEAAQNYPFTLNETMGGIALLAAVQFALLAWSFSDGGASLALMRDMTIVVALALVIPFGIYALAARMSGHWDRLRGANLFLALVLAVAQIVASILANLGMSTTTAVGILAAFCGLAAKNFFGLKTSGAIGVGVAVALGTLVSGLLLLVLPAGKLLFS